VHARRDPGQVANDLRIHLPRIRLPRHRKRLGEAEALRHDPIQLFNFGMVAVKQ